MSCQGIEYQFHVADKPPCQIIYQSLSNTVVNETLSLLIEHDYMECYSGIHVNQITNFSCFGTNAPTYDPTIDPTMDPTHIPTFIPTMDPTIDPTADPTIDPTVGPTTDPTIDPTIDPTAHPSPSPTRNPTPSDAYDSFKNIEYRIDNISTNEVILIAQHATIVINHIERIIEESYRKDEHIALQFSEYWLNIISINHIQTDDIYNDSLSLMGTDSLALESKVYCDEADCHQLDQTNYNETLFEINVANELHAYFDHKLRIISNATQHESIMTFTIESVGEITALFPNPWLLLLEDAIDNETFIFNMILIAMLCIASFIVIICVRNTPYLSLILWSIHCVAFVYSSMTTVASVLIIYLVNALQALYAYYKLNKSN
eukprot:952380_1